MEFLLPCVCLLHNSLYSTIETHTNHIFSLWIGLPVPVSGCMGNQSKLRYTGNQSNLRYTEWHRVRSAHKCKVCIEFHMPSERCLKWAETFFLSDLIAFFLFSCNMLQICFRFNNGGSLVNFYQKVLIEKYRTFQVNICCCCPFNWSASLFSPFVSQVI